jgi:hypothetical protein
MKRRTNLKIKVTIDTEEIENAVGDGKESEYLQNLYEYAIRLNEMLKARKKNLEGK